MKYGVFGALFILVAGWLFYQADRDERQSALVSQAEGLAERIEQFEAREKAHLRKQAQLERMIQQNQHMSRKNAAAAERMPKAAAPPALPQEEIPAERDEEADKVENQEYSLEEKLEDSFAAQHDAEPWDAQMSDSANAAIQAAMPDPSNVYEMDCRGALCRFEFGHKDAAGHDDFVKRWLDNMQGWRGPVNIRRVEQPDGRVLTVAFLGLPGRPDEGMTSKAAAASTTVGPQ